MKRGLMAIVSHPDDETFGCGGTLALHAMQGNQVDVLCMTCYPLERKREFITATTKLGVYAPIVFENKTINLDKRTIRMVSDMIVEKRPQVVITHLPFDYHREHKITFEVVKEAIEWAGHTTIYDKPVVVEKLLLMEVNTLIPIPHVIVDVSESIEKKNKAINIYNTQIAKFSWGYYQKFNIKKAELRGVQGNCNFAEVFLSEPIVQNSPFFPDKNIKNLL
jgi:LmbE family N-acetylglucosaminyl deacetylase